ncbi:MAG: hypothetical protein K2X27_19355 [Candidatus Obscuribacterales bacterium]|nr:hypothetical protein [Candidatus Obscuribacterales bacterium]
MKKISKTEMLAILAAAGLSAGSSAIAADTNNDNALGKTEHAARNLGTESACGKGSCGKDEKGAEAAKAKHEVKKEAKKAKHEVKKEEKAEKKEEKK